MGNELYKYVEEDFKPVTVDVLHMDLSFDVFEDRTIVVSDILLKTKDEVLGSLEFNAMNLDITAVSCNLVDLDWNYDRDRDMLLITFKTPLPATTQFTIHTENFFKPTGNVLEGMYFDETPKGAPQQLITQCQQWGFQRMVPCFDVMNVKCTYKTTIVADKRYTNVITNGDLVEGPVPVSSDRVRYVYDNTVTPMTSYLFFLGLGTYDTFRREFEYPNGKKFMLELLAPPGTDKDLADKSLAMIFDGVLYINLFTGHDKHENLSVAKELYDLVYQREAKLKNGEDVSQLRDRLKELSADRVWGYEYTGTVYREIGMQNSNFGGMENVGNTTITTNRLMPFPDSSDPVVEYVTRVKTHEFYHNINGSEVTGWSPFELWLNEAVTVHIEKEHHEFLFGKNYGRLQEVLGIVSPDGGILLDDSGTMVLPIIPEGFNSPDELITSVTYVKSPEFIKMIQLLVGDKNFVKGLANYHKRFAHGSAKTTDWIECMQEVADFDLAVFAKKWLYSKGYPIVHATRSYNAKKKTYTISLDQVNSSVDDFWQHPIKIALCKASGEVLSEKTFFVDKKKMDLVFSDVEEEPGFVSLNRGYSFYGKLFDKSVTNEELFLQVKNDTDIVAKYFAFYHIFDAEKTRLLQHPNQDVSSAVIDLYFELISDEALMDDVGPMILANFEGVEDDSFAHRYEDLYQVKRKISKAISDKYHKELLSIYMMRKERVFEGDYLHVLPKQIKNRAVKGVALSLLSRQETDEVFALIRDEFQNASAASERNLAAALYLDSKASDRLDFFKEFEEFGKENLVRWEVFLAITASCDSDDVLELIDHITKLPNFRMDQANDQRATFMRYAMNKRLSLLTEKGRAFVKKSILDLTPVNEFTVMHILSIFSHIDLLDDDVMLACYGLLLDVFKSVDAKAYPSVSNNCKKLLLASVRAKALYEDVHGPINLS